MLQTEVYIELSCGIRCREGVKEYEKKMCGNDVNRNNDRIFSWLWKQQGRKRQICEAGSGSPGITDNLALLERCPTGNV